MKTIVIGMLSLLMVSSLFAGQGKVRITSDKEGAYIYVDGKKKAMTGEGFTSILLEEGDHTIKVVKPIDELSQYAQSKEVFVGAETSVKLSFALQKEMTAKGKALQAQKDASKLARFSRSDQVVTDSELGLMWQDDSAAKSVKKSWSSAKSYCTNLALAGYSDWRLPSYEELLSIVDYDRYKPAIMPAFHNVASLYYWSSSVAVSDAKYAWDVNFKSGNTGYGSKAGEGYVRCVRGRQ